MSDNGIKFGEYIRMKRRTSSQSITLSEMAKILGVLPGYLSDVEAGRKMPLDGERMELFANTLGLDGEERKKMYDLAAQERDTIPADVEGYMKGSNVGDMAVVALRATQAGFATEEDWKQLIRNIEKNKGKETAKND